MKIGDSVKWTYVHHLNRYSSTMITKKGIVKRLVGYTDLSEVKQLFTDDIILVQFEGNKYPSRIKYGELKATQ